MYIKHLAQCLICAMGLVDGFLKEAAQHIFQSLLDAGGMLRALSVS